MNLPNGKIYTSDFCTYYIELRIELIHIKRSFYMAFQIIRFYIVLIIPLYYIFFYITDSVQIREIFLEKISLRC